MKHFIREIDGFCNNNKFYSDAVSLYIEKKYWDLLDKAKLVGEKLFQGKEDYKTSDNFYALSPAPNRKYCLTIGEYGIIQQQMSFKNFNDSKQILD